METYSNKLRPFLVAQVARMDRQLLPKRKKSPDLQDSTDREAPANLQSTQANVIRIFTLEMIELLLECIGDRKEEEKILRSFFCHYDAYFAGAPE